MRILFKKLPRV